MEKSLESLQVHNGAFRSSLREATTQVESQSGLDLDQRQKLLREKLQMAERARNEKVAEEKDLQKEAESFALR